MGSQGHTPFGASMRQHFQFAPSYRPLNHGSFGTYPIPVFHQLQKYQLESEQRPDTFIRYTYPRLLDDARHAVAEILHVPDGEVVFVPNVTTAINTVLRALQYRKEDVIVHFATVYGAVEKQIRYLTETTEVEAVKVEANYPVGDDQLVKMFEETIERVNKDRRVKLAVFDTISSMPGVRMPFERLTEVCKKRKVLCVIDGAHGVGQIPLDLSALGADFFTSNCHKWLFVPRGCAVLHVPERNQHLIRSSLPTSHGFEPQTLPGEQKISNPLPSSGKSPFVDMFQFVGTVDNSPYLCVPKAIEFRQEICGGEAKIMQYCQGVAMEGAKKAAEILGTEVMDNAEGTLTRCALVNVRLPVRIGPGESEVNQEDLHVAAQWLSRTLVDDFDTFMAIYFYGGHMWVRFSGQIYLEVEDIVWGAHILKELCQRVAKGEYRKST